MLRLILSGMNHNLPRMGGSTFLRAVCLSWCLTVTAPGSNGQQQAVAHVLDLKGEWNLEAKAGHLTAGNGLAAGAKIAAGSNKPGDFITIVKDDDLSRQRIACDASAANPCQKPIVMPALSPDSAGAPSPLRAMVQATLMVLLDKPPAIASHYAMTLTRGKISVKEWEAVVPLNPTQGLVLPAASAEMRAGSYTISVAQAGDPSKATEEIGVLTSDGNWRPLPVKNPGLYELSISTLDGDQVANLMLLVAPAETYQSAREAFEEVKACALRWVGPDARADEHLLLRSFLLSESRR